MAPKVRTFWWRVIKDILPVTSCLRLRGMNIVDIFCVCGEIGESVYSYSLWKELAGNIDSGFFVNLMNCSWIDFLQHWSSCGLLGVALYVGWALWCNHNSYLYNFSCKMPIAILNLAKNFENDYRQVHNPVERVRTREIVVWNPPIWGWNKLNTDASFDLAIKVSWSGIVLRDFRGEVIVTARKRFIRVVFVLQAELKALRFGLEVVKNEGIYAQCVETNSLNVVDVFHASDSTLSPWLSLILDINALKSDFYVRSISYVSRAGNGLAHRFVTTHGLRDDFSIWHFGLPAAPYA